MNISQTPNKKPSVLIIEDSPEARQRFSEAVSAENNFCLLAAVGTYKDGLTNLKSLEPDIILVDLDLPDGSGISIIESIHKYRLKTQAIVITVFGDEKHVVAALESGASGYLLKDDDFFEINNSISQVLGGGAPISPAIARHMLKRFSLSKGAAGGDEKFSESSMLSPREHEILRFVSKGYTSSEIAEMVNISYHTVTSHVRNIYKKLAVSSRSEAIFEAAQKGLI